MFKTPAEHAAHKKIFHASASHSESGEVMGQHESVKKDTIKKTGTFEGKSNKLGHGGRAAQLRSQLKAKNPKMPESEVGAIIGKAARAAGAAPGGPNYHGHKA